MDRIKYVIVEDYGEWPIVFSAALSHISFAYGRNIVSAGFCKEREDGTWQAWGVSDSLKIASRPEEDSIILTNSLQYREEEIF